MKATLHGLRPLIAAALALATVAATAAADSAASATASAGPTFSLSGPTNAVQATIAAAAGGGVEAFAWVSSSREIHVVPNGWGGPRSWVVARVRLADGRLAPAQRLSPTTGRAFLPVVGVDAEGTVTVAWLAQIRGDHFGVVLATRPPGGRFGAPVDLATTRVAHRSELAAVQASALGPALAVAPGDAAVIAWSGADSMRAATRPAGRCAPAAARACFGAPRSLAPGEVPYDAIGLPIDGRPQIVFGADRTAFLVWVASRGLELAVAPAGRRFEAAHELLPPGQVASDPSAALAGDGSLVIACRYGLAARPFQTEGVEVVVRDRSGAITAPIAMPAATGISNEGAGAAYVLIGPQGRAVIDWWVSVATIVESVRAADGSFTAPVPIAGLIGDEQLLMDAGGGSVIVYQAGPDQEAFLSVRPAGGMFGSSQQLPGSGDAGAPFVLARRPGVVTVGWPTAAGTRLFDLMLAPPA